MKYNYNYALIKSATALVIFTICLSINEALAEPPCSQIDYCGEARGLLKNAEQFRKLAGPVNLRCKTVSGMEYKNLTYKLTADANKDEELAYEEELFKLLGFIPENYDYSQCMVSGAVDSSTALYDYKTKTIVFRNDSGLPAPVAIHELTHLIQDHNFDFKTFEKLEITTDARLALAALREGDAMFSETLATRSLDSVSHPECGELNGSGYSESCEPPPLLGRILMFPYEWGLRFTSILQEEGEESARTQAFKNPPLTSTEILYPKEFLSGEFKPSRLLKSRAKISKHILYTDSLGEFMLRELIKEYAGLKMAGKAARGWGDDIISFEKHNDKSIVKWQIAVRNKSDVEELTRGLNA